jgi:asparagine synthase (glutamine-hydrolysing)
MLDGQGADESLGGYRGYFGAYLSDLIRRGRLRRFGAELSALRTQIGFGRMKSLGYTAAYLFPSLVTMIGRLDNRSYSDPDWLATGVRHVFRRDPIAAASGRGGTVSDMSRAQITATHLPMLLHWEDRNSMAHSIEARVPFLDYRLVEYCLSINDEEKVGGGISKAILRRAMRGVVPDVVLDRRDKMGFVTAESLWAIRDEPKRFRYGLEAAVETLPRFLSSSIVKRFDEVVAGHKPYDTRYWRAICMAVWVRKFGVSC